MDSVFKDCVIGLEKQLLTFKVNQRGGVNDNLIYMARYLRDGWQAFIAAFDSHLVVWGMDALNDLFTVRSRGCKYFVNPPGIMRRSKFKWCSVSFTNRVLWQAAESRMISFFSFAGNCGASTFVNQSIMM